MLVGIFGTVRTALTDALSFLRFTFLFIRISKLQCEVMKYNSIGQ